MIETITYQDVVKAIGAWTPERRLALIRELVRTLELDRRARMVPRNTLARALGLLATNQPPPTDEQIRAWRDERRTEKYG